MDRDREASVVGRSLQGGEGAATNMTASAADTALLPSFTSASIRQKFKLHVESFLVSLTGISRRLDGHRARCEKGATMSVVRRRHCQLSGKNLHSF